MELGLPPLTLGRWLLAVAPVVVLATLVARSRLTTAVTSVVTLGLAVVVAVATFGATGEVLTVAGGKGIWTGVWILYVVWPALLLYQFAKQAGLERIGEALETILPRRVENVLVVAWVLPSFIQGVAGFGTPIAVSAPLLLAMGLRPVAAIAIPLIGHHWAITFGSMGSSFYMGAFTAQLTGDSFDAYATRAAGILAVNCLLAGVLVCYMFGGRQAVRDGARTLVVVGPVMAVVLVAAVQIEPSIGSVSAGAAGLVTVAALRRVMHGSTTRPDLRVLTPYAYLLVLVLAVFVPSPSRDWVKSHLLVAPSFEATRTTFGFATEAVDTFTPIALLGHPGTFVLMAALLGWVTYRRLGLWPDGAGSTAVAAWIRQGARTTVPIVALATLATVMAETGMVGLIANGAAEVTGSAYPAIAPFIGALGSFTTGSSTNSNALFSALQRDVAGFIDVEPATLLAAQTSGANVGNTLAPVIALVGASAIDAGERLGGITRRVAPAAAVLVASVVASTLLLVWRG